MHTGSTRSQVQPCRGQTGIHKHAHTHIRMTTQAQYGPWYLSATCAQTPLSLEIPATPQKAPLRVTLEKPPPNALNRLWSPGPPPRHPYSQPSVPTRRRRTPPGAGLEPAQRPRELEKASMPQLEGQRGPPPHASPGPAACLPSPTLGVPGAHRSLGRRTWVSRELEAEMGLSRDPGSAGLFGALLSK